MFFRDDDSSTHSSVAPDEFSSGGGSLSSSESFNTRAFEKKVKSLLTTDPISNSESRDNIPFPSDPLFDTKDAINVREKDLMCPVDTVEEGEQVSFFNCDDDSYWSPLMDNPDDVLNVDTEFHEYPPPDYFKSCPPPPQAAAGSEVQSEVGSITSTPAHHHHGTKMFIGGLRFEVVQSGRHLISWIFEVACGVRLPPNSILVHRRAKGGRSGSPTGCASVFVANMQDVEKLLSMNQCIFCGERGVYVASSMGHMAELISKKAVVNVTDGRIRGPTHPVVIERAYGSAGNHGSRHSASSVSHVERTQSGVSTPHDAGASSNSLPGASPMQLSSNPSSLPSSMSISMGLNVASAGDDPNSATTSTGNTVLLKPTKELCFQQYPGDATASQLIQHLPVELKRPVALFVGGFAGEPNREFVAWVFSLICVSVHPNNVSLYVDSQTGERGGCAHLRVEESDVSRATGWSKRILCSPHGVYFADSPREAFAMLAARDKTAPMARQLIIKRKDSNRGGPKPTTLPMGPPPSFQGAWDPTQLQIQSPEMQSQQMLGWQPGAPARPPPPPYMQSVVIGNQTYQVPLGASIQLQLVPVITGPNIPPTTLPIQAAAQPPPLPMTMYQSMQLPLPSLR